MKDNIKLRTEVNIELIRNNETIDKRKVKNLVSNVGLNMIADRIVGGTTPIVNKIAIGNSNTAELRTDTALGSHLAELAAIISRQNNVITYEANFTQNAAYEVKEAGLLNASNVLYARTTFPVVNKGVNDTLKITWKWTIQ